MFGTPLAQCIGTENIKINQYSSCKVNKSSQKFKQNQMHRQRQNIFRRKRLLNSAKIIDYAHIKSNDFAEIVANEQNSYSMLLTIFAIVDQFSWRQYIFHLQVLIQKITNIITQSKGCYLQGLNDFQSYNFLQRISKMLYLSNRSFQQHLLMLVNCIVTYNNIYGIIDQKTLSEHLVHRHNFQKYINEESIWILTRMSVNQVCVSKILRNFSTHEDPRQIVLPFLTILSNYIADQECIKIEHLILIPEFQNIIQIALLSENYQIQREGVLLCNNILLKSNNCYVYFTKQTDLMNKILMLQNQEVKIFRKITNII